METPPLLPEVRAYAEQRATDIRVLWPTGATDIPSLTTAVRDGHVSTEHLRTIAVRTNELRQVIETGELPFREKFHRALQDFIRRYGQWRAKPEHQLPEDTWTDDTQLTKTVAFLAQELRSLPIIPAEHLSEDPRFLDSRILSELWMNEPLTVAELRTLKQEFGLIISLVYNRAYHAAPAHLRDRFTQVINLEEGYTRRMPFLGYRFPGGALTIRGDAGPRLGQEMSGGTITASSADHGAGYRMSGGDLRIEQPPTDDAVARTWGHGKTGGRIFSHGVMFK